MGGGEGREETRVGHTGLVGHRKELDFSPERGGRGGRGGF